MRSICDIEHSMNNKTLNIDLGERSYKITIGSGLLQDMAELLPFDVDARKCFFIADENTARYVPDYGQERLLVLPAGEATKSYEQLIKIHDWLLSLNVHRNSVVFAVGGGVIGDLAGFAAASVLRGVPFVQIPTSLLAQVDSSVGGKTGINSRYGKNLVGAFYQPEAVIIDTDSLSTLPRRELLAGYAEIVKYGLIGDLEFFEWLEQNGERVLSLDKDAVSHAIEVSCRAKARVVEADEREDGVRALLNLGHTFGHALEAAAGYDGTLLHGEGVSIGTVMAYRLSERMGFCTADDVSRVIRHFESVGLPVHAQSIDGDIQDFLATMRRDKKALDDTMVFIVPRGIGDAFVSKDVFEKDVIAVLEQSLSGEA